MFFVYWRVSLHIYEIPDNISSINPEMFYGSIMPDNFSVVLGWGNGPPGDGLQHVVDEEDVRDGPWHPEATSHPLLHNSWR